MNNYLFLIRLKKVCHLLRSIRFMRALVFHQVLAGVEHRRILTAELGTVVDVGANRGQFTLAARRWAHKANVIAFEPLAEAADRFRNLFYKDSKVTIFQTAIGPERCEMDMHVAGMDDSSSLLPITKLQEKLYPGTGEIKRNTVKVQRLSDSISLNEINAPAMLKIDVQGYELEALRGCEKMLDRFSYVYAECSFIELYSGQALVDDIIAWLRERGWCLSGIYNMTYNHKGKSVQADFLFENSCFERAV